ncbi:P-loop containing nucleoside triphosphate hydrolase protein [Chytridium lagenaria]|nr:P-loop containing nucleoside triphosphate hydrolase protein [Chytridium lagenaria]
MSSLPQPAALRKAAAVKTIKADVLASVPVTNEKDEFKVHNTGIKRKADTMSAGIAKPIESTSFLQSRRAKPESKPIARPKASASSSLMSSTASSQLRSKNPPIIAPAADSNEPALGELASFRSGLENTISTKELENSSISTQLKQYQDKVEAASEVQRQLERKVTSLEEDCRRKDSEKEQIVMEKDGELDRMRTEVSNLKNLLSEQASKLFAHETEVSLLKSTIRKNDDDISEKANKIDRQSDKIAELEKIREQLEEKLRSEETLRRKLHNTIQELKGNIRVFCRIRPPISSELMEIPAPLSHISLSSTDDRTIEIKQTLDNAAGSSYVKAIPFAFDKVFPPQTSQKQVFDEISQLVQSALDGYNVLHLCLWMEGGSLDDGESSGMIPLAVEQIFAAANQLASKGWTYEFEIYFWRFITRHCHDIKHNAGKTIVTDITTVPVSSPLEVHDLLKKAALNRAVAATNCNERSSRSHSVFTLRLSGKNSLTGESSDGTLNLIDLAGSERLSSSGSTGDRLKETQAINKSLSSLGDVIFSISNKDSHVPYRNSKLTYLLQNSLGGNSKTLMFVNVSPMHASLSETLCSLRFATKVNNCNIGTARANPKAK